MTNCTRSHDRSFNYLDSLLPDMRHGLLQIAGRDQTDVGRARERVLRFRLEFPTRLVQIDFLIAEFEGDSPSAELFPLHPQYRAIKRSSGIDVGDRENDVIDMRDLHGV